VKRGERGREGVRRPPPAPPPAHPGVPRRPRLPGVALARFPAVCPVTRGCATYAGGGLVARATRSLSPPLPLPLQKTYSP